MSLKIRNLSGKTLKLSQHLQYIFGSYLNEVLVFQQQNILFLFVRAQVFLFFPSCLKTSWNLTPLPLLCFAFARGKNDLQPSIFSHISIARSFSFFLLFLRCWISISLQMRENSPPAKWNDIFYKYGIWCKAAVFVCECVIRVDIDVVAGVAVA